jgi:hypothetical protein
MHTYISRDREKPEIDLYLASDKKSVFRFRPSFIEVLKLGDWWVEVGWFGKGFLHWAFNEAVWECEAAWKGQRLGDQVDGGFGILLVHVGNERGSCIAHCRCLYVLL